jgi:hypothetical protein
VKAPVNFIMSVHITVAPIGQISMKFDTGDFYGNLSGMSKFNSIWQKAGTPCGDLSIFYVLGDIKSP